jgi:hypothetical protein
LPHPSKGDFLGEPVVPLKENVKVVITQSSKSSVEPETKSKRATPINPVEKEDEAEAEVEAEPRPEKEGVDLEKASLKDVSDTHVLPFPRKVKKPMEDEKFSHFIEVIRKMYVHIPMLDAMEVPTYAKYMKDILNQKWPLPEMNNLLHAKGCSVAILDGLPNKMGDLGIPTISCLIGRQSFDQALCDLGASVSIMPKVIYDKLSHDSLVPTSMHL